jgi:hypothetical protein
MHMTNLVEDEERPEAIRKPIVPELDLEDLKAIAEAPPAKSADFSASIALAASSGALALKNELSNAEIRAANALAKEEFRAIAESIKQKYGVAIGYTEPWAYRPKPRAAYGLWKRVITIYLDRPETLAIGPTAMAAQLNKSEMGYIVKRDMFYDKLNAFAKKDLERLLKKFGVALELRGPVSINSVRKALIQKTVNASGSPFEEFTGRFVIRGNTVTVNGTEFKIQHGKTGKPRIKHRGEWLPLNVLKSICSSS